MKKVILLSCLAVLLANTQFVQARDPVAVAESSINRATTIADKFCSNTLADANQCVSKINQLLQNGDIDRADKIATSCITSIQRARQRAMNRINRVCNAGYLTLIKYLEVELAQEVEATRQQLNDQVMDVGEEAILSIQEALYGSTAE